MRLLGPQFQQVFSLEFATEFALIKRIVLGAKIRALSHLHPRGYAFELFFHNSLSRHMRTLRKITATTRWYSRLLDQVSQHEVRSSLDSSTFDRIRLQWRATSLKLTRCRKDMVQIISAYEPVLLQRVKRMDDEELARRVNIERHFYLQRELRIRDLQGKRVFGSEYDDAADDDENGEALVQ